MENTPKRGLEKLEEEYKNSIPEKIDSLQKHIENLRQAMNEETLKTLRIEVHKIAGTAGSFGFSQVSKICKEFEQDLIQKMKEFPSFHGNSQWITDLDNYLIKVRKGFSHPNET
jgi:HPt (histidine-containing phosphotransfer) domain-containing protein